MTASRSSLLMVSDFTYQARGRRYCDEDIYLSSRLREHFDVAVCHPHDAAALMDGFRAVLVRNSGPVVGYPLQYEHFRAKAAASGARVYNELTGKGDMVGKQYLLDLFQLGYPVIPTVARAAELGILPRADSYVVKPIKGADSIGMRILTAAEVRDVDEPGVLIQPRVDFEYEVSFYFVDHSFQYALHAPDPDRRWELVPYETTDADLAFAQRFIDWNSIDHGIQRVDACRTRDGELLLVELEDLNPYLSLDRLEDEPRESFIRALTQSLTTFTDLAA